jgi:hypothetical protein
VQPESVHGNTRFVAHFRRTRCLQLDHRPPTREWGSGKMQNTTAETAKKDTRARTLSGESSLHNIALDRCYRQIGISAVVAAVRYQGVVKNPAYAPVAAKWRERAEEVA